MIQVPRLLPLVVAALWTGWPTPALDASADEPSGQSLFEQKCSSCHASDLSGEEEWGPNLSGLLDRRVGSLPGYSYGSYLRDQQAQGASWDSESLGPWLVDSKAVAKAAGGRTKMPAQNISQAETERLLGYLETL